MNIYALKEILSSKPHNPHYLKRYIRFIESCQTLNEDYVGYTEKHHICPKSLFPEYKSLKEHPWNKAVLTARQHFIAHWILWKAYPEMKSMQQAFFLMCHKNNNKLDARTYARLSEEYSIRTSESALKRVADKTHNLLSGDIQRESALKRVADKTHNFLGGENNLKRVADKTHPFLGGEIQRKRVDDKTHNLLGGENNLKRVREGTHNLLGSVSCYDKQGTSIRVPKEIYHSQTGPKEDREYVHVSTKEAKRRKQ